MIIEGLDKVSRKEFKSLLRNVDGVMLKTRQYKRSYAEPKNVEVVYVCLDLDTKINAVNRVKSALVEVRANSNARFLA